MDVDNKLIPFVQNLNSATLKNIFHAASNTQNEWKMSSMDFFIIVKIENNIRHI